MIIKLGTIDADDHMLIIIKFTTSKKERTNLADGHRCGW